MSNDHEKEEMKLEDQAEAAVADRMEDMNTVKPSDRTKPFTVAQFKGWRKNIMENLNEVLQKFQRDVVGGQARINLAWNGMNAVIRALVNKGLINEHDIRIAGVELMNEARQNIEKARVAVEGGGRPQDLHKTPLEEMRDSINEEAAKAKKEG